MRVGDEITIEATELVAGGAALARVDGLPLFVMNVFPGDHAIVRVTEAKKGFARAELVRIITPSVLRRSAPCPIAEECGGCDWTALRLDAQLQAKKRILTESLRRIGKIDPATLPPIALHPSPLNYRLRSRLHVENGATGFFAMRSNRVVQLSRDCEVVGVETAKRFGATEEKQWRTGALACPTPLDNEDKRGRLSSTGLDGELSVWEVDGRLIGAGEELTIRVDDHTFHLSTDAFFQVNRHLLSTMLRLVGGHAARCAVRRSAIDLYSGVGFFSAPIALSFERVTAVEGSVAGSVYGRRNAAPNVEVVQAPVEDWVDRMPQTDFVFLDPPRAGARKNVIERVAERTGSMICFLACDPVIFARDASRLIASGWRLATLDLLDLFPNTHHVETLSSFERAPS